MSKTQGEIEATGNNRVSDLTCDQPAKVAKVEPADEDPDLVDEFKAEFRERWLNALDLAEVSTPDPLSFNGSKPPKTVYMRLSSGERLGEDSRICEAHFHPQEVLSHPNPRLIPEAIPSQLLKFPEPGPEFEAKAFGDFKLGFFKGKDKLEKINVSLVFLAVASALIFTGQQPNRWPDFIFKSRYEKNW